MNEEVFLKVPEIETFLTAPLNHNPMSEWKKAAKRAWKFLWEDDSMLSWVVNIALAFVIIKYIVYPLLGLVLGTGFPVVAVVSGSMEHKMVYPCLQRDMFGNCLGKESTAYEICGKRYTDRKRLDLDSYWEICGDWYVENSIEKEEFTKFIFKNGFNTGDIIVLLGTEPEEVEVGDVIVFKSSKPYPIIHRVVSRTEAQGAWVYETKGDHNPGKGPDDVNITEDRLIGKAVFRIPYLGWIKIVFFRIIGLVIGIFAG
jgi:signal peptidase I